jgi:hypothetical protein
VPRSRAEVAARTRATAVLADDERENSADGGHAGDEPGDVVVDDAALEALGRDGQAGLRLIAPAEHREAAPVEGGLQVHQSTRTVSRFGVGRRSHPICYRELPRR